jgi:Fur family ferric uptake transcriptional regulator
MNATESTNSEAVQLRDAGLRVTKQRLAVMAAAARGGHPTVEAIAQRARDEIGSVSLQATYGVLHTLAASGLVRRIEPVGQPARYETRVGDNHHHLVCRECGAVTDAECAVSQAPCLEPADADGYLVDEAEVTYWGLCPSCREAA